MISGSLSGSTYILLPSVLMISEKSSYKIWTFPSLPSALERVGVSIAFLLFTTKMILSAYREKASSCSIISFKICSVGSFSSSRNARICFPSAVSSDAFTVLPSSFLRVNSGMEIFSSMSSRFAFRNASSTLFISPI